MNCTRCQQTGFLNLHQIPEGDLDAIPLDDYLARVKHWIANCKDRHDVQVCDCCGDGQTHYGEPGQHTITGSIMTFAGRFPVWDCGRVPECI